MMVLQAESRFQDKFLDSARGTTHIDRYEFRLALKLPIVDAKFSPLEVLNNVKLHIYRLSLECVAW